MDRRLLLACLLIVVGTVSWRREVYFSGALDTVVLAKAVLACAALFVAVTTKPTQDGVRAPWMGAVWFLGVYVCVSTLGAWASGDVWASGILAIRLLLTAAVIFFLARSYPGALVMRALAISMAMVGAVSAVTGFLSLGLVAGRLLGGIPPLTPNELSLLCGIGLIYILWRCIQGLGRWYDVAGGISLFAVFWATGSRTGLAVLLGAILVMLLQARRLPVGVFVISVASMPVLFYVITSTAALAEHFGRGGWQNISTFSSRTIAWRAAIELPDTWWERWLGGGLALKRIAVPARWWSEQGLDSSVISGLVQTGIAGLVLLSVWALVTAVRACRAPFPERMLWTSLLAFVAVRGLLESGLFDASPAFLVFFLITLVAGPPNPRSLVDEDVPSERSSIQPPPVSARSWPQDRVMTTDAGSVRRTLGGQ
jgi:hypothetical protein